MAKLYGKYKLQDWIEVEKTNPASQRTEIERAPVKSRCGRE